MATTTSFFDSLSAREREEYFALHAALGSARSNTARRDVRWAIERFEARHRARLTAAANRRAAVAPIGAILAARHAPSGVPMFIGT